MKRIYNRKIKTNARKSVHRRNYRNFTKKYNKTTCKTLRNRFTSKITNTHKRSLKMIFRKTNVNLGNVYPLNMMFTKTNDNFDNAHNYPLKIINKKKFVTVKPQPKHTVNNINLKNTVNHKIIKINLCNMCTGYLYDAKHTNFQNRKILKVHNEMRTKLNMNEIQPTFKLVRTIFLPELYSDFINARRIKTLITNIMINDEILNEFMHNKKIPIIKRDKFEINMNDTAKYFSDEYKKYECGTMFVVLITLLYACSLVVIIPALTLCFGVFMTGVVLMYGFWKIVFDM